MAKVVITIEDIPNDGIDAHVVFEPEANFQDKTQLTHAQRIGRRICGYLHNIPGEAELIEVEDASGNVTNLLE